MERTRIPRARLAATLGAGALLLAPLTACTADGGVDGSAAASSASSAAGALSSAAGSAAGSAGQKVDVNCSGTSCSLTLRGANSSASVLGTTVSLQSVSGGQATVRVGDRQVSCTQGQSVGAGPLRLQCSEIGDDSLTLRASLG